MTLDLHEYARTVQQQRSPVQTLRGKAGLQREVVEDLIQRPPRGAADQAVDRVVRRGVVEGLDGPRIHHGLSQVAHVVSEGGASARNRSP